MNYTDLLKLNNINIQKISSLDSVFRMPKTLLSPERLSVEPTADSIFDILMDSAIRRGDGMLDSKVKAKYKEKISKFIAEGSPLEFTFQGLPFKCKNPTETLRKTPDLGEIAFLQRLVDINETIMKIYPPGARFTVLTEGSSYKNLFGATSREAHDFEEKCRFFRDKLGAKDLVKFVDFMDLPEDKKDFKERCRKEEEALFKSNLTPGRREEIKHLTYVMMRSLPITKQIPVEDLLAVYGFRDKTENFTAFQEDLFLYLFEAAKEIVYKYLAIQNVKKDLSIIESVFPNHLYVSTTAKTTRYSFHPIHRRTRLYPHHGVAVLSSDKVDIVFLGEILSNPGEFTAVYAEDDIEDSPFYFLKGRQHRKMLY